MDLSMLNLVTSASIDEGADLDAARTLVEWSGDESCREGKEGTSEGDSAMTPQARAVEALGWRTQYASRTGNEAVQF